MESEERTPLLNVSRSNVASLPWNYLTYLSFSHRYYDKKYQVFRKLVEHQKEYSAIMNEDWTKLTVLTLEFLYHCIWDLCPFILYPRLFQYHFIISALCSNKKELESSFQNNITICSTISIQKLLWCQEFGKIIGIWSFVIFSLLRHSIQHLQLRRGVFLLVVKAALWKGLAEESCSHCGSRKQSEKGGARMITTRPTS